MRLAVQPLLTAPDPRRQAEGLEAELRLTLPSDVRLVEDVVEVVARHLEQRFVDRHSVRFNLRVALSEALINAILYGNGEDDSKGVALRVLFGRHAVEMEVTLRVGEDGPFADGHGGADNGRARGGVDHRALPVLRGGKGRHHEGENDGNERSHRLPASRASKRDSRSASTTMYRGNAIMSSVRETV